VFVCIRHWFLTLIQLIAFCLQETAETETLNTACSGGVECMFTVTGATSIGGTGNLFKIRHGNFGLTNVW
jgi:hypothetical protein